MERQALGVRGETLACEALVARGYIIRHRRYRTRYGELDIVADHGGVLVFAEVRARASGRFGDGAESVTAQKQQRVAAMAEAYMGLEQVRPGLCRFDVVAVDASIEPPMVTVYPDAFRPGW
ncbi:MAG: YraN family protein [Acidobacteria bacterium]|nr:YraN family protein [Acidobacteriota bacterium]